MAFEIETVMREQDEGKLASTAHDQLLEYETDLKRWERILGAIEQREQLESQCKVKRAEAEALEKGLFRFEEYQKAKADEARLRADLKKVEASIATTNENISELSSRLKLEVASLIMKTELCFGDVFRGANEYETTAALQGELEALVEKEEALARDWNAHIHGLKATFDHVLKNLDDVRSAAAKINRAFAKIQVSNLKAVKLEVVEQSDLVSWVKRLAAFEPGGLFDADPQQESAIANFRRKIQDNPVIRFTNLFTLSFTVIGADDQRHTYHDFRQIESHGTTITLKVLFNLLLLKDQLRRDDCAVPFPFACGGMTPC
jgi:hypothetical protein